MHDQAAVTRGMSFQPALLRVRQYAFDLSAGALAHVLVLRLLRESGRVGHHARGQVGHL